MVRPINVLDLAAVAAVLILVVGTPSYIAAGDVARSLPSDGVIDIRPLHVGDRASFTLLVTEPDGTSRRSGTLLELTVERAFDPYTSRDGFALNWTQVAANASVGRVQYATETATVWYRWSESGVPGMGEVVTESRPAAEGIDDGPLAARPSGPTSFHLPATDRGDDAATFDGTPRQDTYRMVAPRASETLRPLSYSQVQYRPAGLDTAIRALPGDVERRLGEPRGPSDAAPVRSFLAAEYEERLFLAVAPRAYSNEDPLVATQNGHRVYVLSPSHILLDHALATNIVRTAAPILWDHTLSWSWVTPDLGAVAGFHQELRDAEGELLLTLDLLPSTIEPGDGEAVAPVQVNAPTVTPPSARASTTLGALHTDTRPLHQNLSLADVADHLESEAAPATIRSFMAADAYFGGYAYQMGTTVEGQRPVTDLLPDDAGSLRFSTGLWHVVLLHEDGAVRVARMEITEAHGTGDHVVSVSDVCGAQSPAFFTYDCTRLQVTDALARDRTIADPLVLRADFTERHEAHGHDHARVDHFYLPLYRVNESGFSHDPMSAVPSYWDGMVTGGVGWRAMTPQGGLMNLHYGTNRDRYDLGTAALLFSHERVEADDDVPPVTPMRGEAAAAPLPVTEADARLILTGVTLFAAAVVTRFFLAFWMHLLWLTPGWLYSRIPQDKVLKNAHRQAALQAITDDPGMSLSEVNERLGLTWGTTVHHLRTLERAGLITSLPEGRNRHFFATGTLSPAEMRQSLVHRKPVYRELLALVAARPGISLPDVASRLDRDVSGISRTGTRLARLGALKKRRVDGKMCYYLVPSADPTPRTSASTEPETGFGSVST